MKPLISALCALLLSCISMAQTTLSDGDIAFTRINMDDEQFSFLFLVNVSSGTEFFITDHSWNGAGFHANESIIKFVVNNAISAGDVCHVNSLALTYTMASATSPMTISSVGVFNPTAGNMLGSGGDNLFAYQNSPSFNVIAGVNANAGVAGSSGNAWLVSTSVTTAGSAIPTGQTNGADGFVGLYPSPLNPEVDNARYKSTSLHSGTKAALLAELLDYSKWEFDNGTAFGPGTTSFSVSLPPTPVSASITAQTNLTCPGTSTGSITATATDGVANFDYDWSNGSSTSNTSATTNTILNLAAGTYTVTITDDNGNTSTASATITSIPDNIAPVITICASTPSNIPANGSCQGTTPDLTGSVTATDNCTASPTITQSPSSGAILGLGTTTITLTATDGSGNTATCTVNQTVVDITAPIITVCASTPSNIPASNSCTGTAPNLTGAVTATDNCTGSPTITQSPSAGATLGLGTTTITLTATDGSGNTATCTVNQTVVDNTAPIITVCSSTPSNISADLACQGTAPNLTGAVTATDNCTGSPVITQSPSAGATLGLGTTTITLTATDGSGNTATCTVNQTVVDNTAPDIAICATTPSNLVAGSGGTAPASDLTGSISATDNCTGTPTITQSPVAGATLGLGTTTITLTATDGSGNTATCTVNQTVINGLSINVVSQTNVDCSGNSTGAATVSASSGAAPYTYAWSNGSTTASINGVASGIYTVTVSDFNSVTATNMVTITEPSMVTASAVVDSNVSCNAFFDGGASASATGGTGPYTYLWNNGSTNVSITGVNATTYTVTITDANACTGVTNVTITEPAAIQSTLSFTEADCYGAPGALAFVDTAYGGIPIVPVCGSAAAYACGGTPKSDTIGTGTGTNGTTSYPAPYGNWYWGAKHQIIYRQAELNAMGIMGPTMINSIAFDVASISGTSSYTNLNIKMGCTSDTLMDSWKTGLISVYSQGTYTVATGWNTHVFSTPYLWDGQSNIVMEVCFNNSGFTNNSATRYTPTAYTSVRYYRADISTVCSNTSSTTGTSQNRPNTIFNTCNVAGGYNYAWSNSGTTDSILNVTAGTYTVTITDSKGCSSVNSVTVTDPDELVASTVVDDNVSCNGLVDGAATSSGTGGTGAYVYTWSNAATTASITGLAAGTYSVTLTDNNGCTDSTNVTVTEPAVFSVNASTIANTINALANGSASSSGLGGTAPYTFVWSNGATTAALNNVLAGTYTVTATDANGCTAVNQTTLTNTFVTTVSVSSQTNVSCNGGTSGTATASATNGVTPYTYLWSNGATTATANGLAAGTYTVTVTDNNGTTDATTITITEPTALVGAAVVDSNVTCNAFFDGGATSSASGGTGAYTYLWSNGATTASITGVNAATYSVTVTDANGCSNATSVTITEPAVPSYPVAVDADVSCNSLSDGALSIAAGQPVVMHFEGFENYTGSGTHTSSTTLAGLTGVEFSTSTTQGRIRIPAGAGYVRTGSFSATMDATVTGASPDPQNAITTTFDMTGMAGSAVTLDFWFMDHGEEPDANDRTWIRGDDLSPWIEVYNFVSPNLSNGTWHNVVVNNLDSILTSNGQSFSATFGVRFGQADNFPSTSISASDGITIDDISIIAGGGAGLNFAWSTGDTTSAVTGLTAGTYSVTVTNGTGCTAVEMATVTEPTQLVSSASVDTNIACGNVQNGAASVVTSGGTPGYTYQWSSNDTSASITGMMAGMYTVTVTDGNMCTTIDTITIMELDSTISLLATQDITVYLDANGEVVINAMQIDNGTMDSCGIVSMTINDSVFSCSNVGVNNVIFTAVDGSGNMESDTVAVTVMDTNSQILFGNYTLFESTCNGTNDAKILTSTNGGNAPYTYAWNNGSNFTNLSNLTPGQYVVTVTDANGCTQIDSIDVTEPDVLDPNVSGVTPLCFGENNGSVISNTLGGTMPYAYQWNTSDTTNGLTGLFGGTYEVTVTDARNCSATESYMLQQPQEIDVTVTAPNVNCSADSNGTASVVATGGVGQLTYLWEDGSTINSVSGLGVGSYQVTVTDTNMCEMITTFFVAADFENPTVDLGPDQTITWQEDFTFDAENPGATYNWSTGETSQLIDVFVNSDTTIWVNVTGDGGCMTSDTITITLDEVIGVAEIAGNVVSLYPNPTHGETQLLVGSANAQTMKVRVLDVAGAMLWMKEVNTPQTGDRLSIDLSRYSAGMYFISVQMDEEQILFKVNKL